MMIFTYILFFIISYVFHQYGFFIYSSIFLLLLSIILYVEEVRKSGLIINFRGILSIGFIGGLGISLLKLSNLASPFELKTWICFFVVYPIFYFAYEIATKKFIMQNENILKDLTPDINTLEKKASDKNAIRAFTGLLIISICIFSLICFFIEAYLLKFIPLFTIETPHAYSTFHIKGLHYLTITYTLIPSIGVLYYNKQQKIDFVVLLSAIYPAVLSLLLVSRSGIILSYILMFFTFVVQKSIDKDFLWERKNSYYIIKMTFFFVLLIIVIASLYIVVSIYRAHTSEYLIDIFDLKDKNIPIWIQQPYIYIANNYENFNYLVKNIGNHAFGLKGLYPFFTFSGLKFLFPSLTQFFLYINKAELTTGTFIYDAYYDFGVLGVIFFSFLIGFLCGKLNNIVKKTKNIFYYILYAQISYYLFFSFFACWFSLPQTYFYLIIN
ncbi:MAG: O-antigen polymerase, partial [Eubacteriales bacterium]|nr:O-antigen polymerase [Eubacteriales bacterium]